MLLSRVTRSVLFGQLILCCNSLCVLAASPLTLINEIDSPVPSSSGHFGQSANGDNGNVLAGAPTQNVAYLMDINTGAPILTVPSPDAGHVSFGESVIQVGQNFAVSDSDAKFGAKTSAGAVYIFDGATGQNVRTIHDPNVSNESNFGVSLETTPGRLFVSAASQSTSGTGTVYSFNPSTGQLLSTITNPDLGSGYGFGFDLEADGGRLFISATGAPVSGVLTGAVYRYDATAITPNLKISAPVPQANSMFGWALDHNSTQLLVGAPNFAAGGHSFVGQAYLFDSNSGALLQTFADPEPQDLANFGQSVALIGNYAVIGAPGEDLNPGQPGSTHVGAAYIFNANNGAYLGKIVNPSGGQNNAFAGGSGQNSGLVTIGNLLVAMNSRNNVSGISSAGAVYVYSVPEPTAVVSALLGAAILTATLLRRRKTTR